MAVQTRELVVAEAKRLFFQFGFRRITMDEIARNLRMSKKTLYALFPAKEALIRAVVESIMEPNLSRLRELMQNEKTVAAIFSGSMAVFHGLSQSISEPMMSDMRTMPEIWREVESRRQNVLLGLRKALERGKRSGEIRPDLHVDLFLRIYILIVNAVGNPAVMMELNLKPSELADQIYAVFFHGIMNDGRQKRGAS
jgi:AcrR family transcriptional regulator